MGDVEKARQIIDDNAEYDDDRLANKDSISLQWVCFLSQLSLACARFLVSRDDQKSGRAKEK